MTADRDSVYLTLLAIYILEEGFPNDEDEWTLILDKAIAYLQLAGLQRPESIVKKFSLVVLEE